MIGSPTKASELVFTINGEKYLVASPEQASEAGGPGRVWNYVFIPDQVASDEEFHLALDYFSEGGGFTFEGVEGTYDIARGWDASAPGKVATWPKMASGEETVSADYKGWLVQFSGYLYMFRGRYVSKYALDDVSGGTWEKVDTKDLGANMAVPSMPCEVNGKLLIPLINTSTGVLDQFVTITAVGATTDTYDTTGEAGLEARHLAVWGNKVVMADSENQLRTASVGSTDWGLASNWVPSIGSSDGYVVDDPGVQITALLPYGPYLIIWTEKGPKYLDEEWVPQSGIPDLAAERDEQNGLGAGYANGWLLAPHRGGFVQWAPNGPWMVVGPEMEGGMEGDKSPGWGRVSGSATYGRMTFVTANGQDVASLLSFQPPKKRTPYAVHFHQQHESATYEDCQIVRASAQPVTPFAPGTWSDDNAVGTITWSDTGNAEAEDGTFATAAAGTSHYLKGLNPNPAIPTDATLLGVEVVITRGIGEA